MKAFLRARRAAIQPSDVGIVRGERRRVQGLRREEVAQLSGVGVTWYTWLEQGRDINVSPNALQRIARGLRLLPADVDYMFSLLNMTPVVSNMASGTPVDFVNLVEGYRWPAAVVSPLLDVVAANRSIKLLYGLDNALPPFKSNHLWQLMLNPNRRSLLCNYDTDARHFIALFRLTSAKYVDTPEFLALRKALLEQSAYFRQVWAESRVEPPSPRSVQLQHEKYGRITVSVTRAQLPEDHFLFLLAPADPESGGRLLSI